MGHDGVGGVPRILQWLDPRRIELDTGEQNIIPWGRALDAIDRGQQNPAVHKKAVEMI
jgi:hypothetical protein